MAVKWVHLQLLHVFDVFGNHGESCKRVFEVCITIVKHYSFPYPRGYMPSLVLKAKEDGAK